MTATVPESPADSCVFCTRQDQPPILFETPLLYAMPDKYPLVPGHILIIAREHVRCYGAASRALLDEVDAAAARVSRFLTATYGGPVLINETGVAGQSVYHAHLHLTPWPSLAALPEMPEHQNVTPVEGWDAVRAYFARHGRYFYVDTGRQRYLISSYDSPVVDTMRRALARALGVTVSGHSIARAATAADAQAVADRWRDWPR